MRPTRISTDDVQRVVRTVLVPSSKSTRWDAGGIAQLQQNKRANPIEAGLLEDTDGTSTGTLPLEEQGISARCLVCLLVLLPLLRLRPARPVGATTIILGNGLSGSTSVTFGGVRAAFTVNQTGTAITATVPMGATTGTVTVVTPSAT